MFRLIAKDVFFLNYDFVLGEKLMHRDSPEKVYLLH